jgi:deoxyribonuclease V
MPRGKSDPDWPDLIASWKQAQLALRAKMIVAPLDPLPRYVAGADAAFSADKTKVFAAAVIYDRIEKRIIEVARATRPVEFPYIPTFLSFREAPTVMDAIAKLKHEWGVICLDGQGYAHPRRCGLAAHISILLNRPGVGIVKSRLIGTFADPPKKAGSSPLMDGDEQIGLALRTRDAVKPLFISIGHRIDLPSAAKLALACVSKYRIPEPTRQADIEAAKLKSDNHP